jgi:hypothetical protein
VGQGCQDGARFLKGGSIPLELSGLALEHGIATLELRALRVAMAAPVLLGLGVAGGGLLVTLSRRPMVIRTLAGTHGHPPRGRTV